MRWMAARVAAAAAATLAELETHESPFAEPAGGAPRPPSSVGPSRDVTFAPLASGPSRPEKPVYRRARAPVELAGGGLKRARHNK